MAGWLAEIEGDLFDTEEFPYWFPNGQIYAFREKDKVFLTGDRFDSMVDAHQVYEASCHIIDELYAVISLLDMSILRPKIGHIFSVDDQGKRTGHVFASGSVTPRGKVHARASVIGKDVANEEALTTAQKMLLGISGSKNIKIAMSLWADPMRTWPRLYRILEEIELHLGMLVNEANLCPKGERKRFTHSANAAEIAGPDSRHAGGKFSPPKNPMNLEQGAGFISGILKQVLEIAYENKK